MANPYEPGTDEYLDYATSQHDEAMKPKPKMKKKKKKMMGKVEQAKPTGLASALIDKNKTIDDAYNQMMSSGTRVKR